ncbi:MAG TPA: hypothetical protein DEQ34_11550 [Balneolaceae bacterium]|nr:hypothetical protein [Balneolaceae bacterium]
MGFLAASAKAIKYNLGMLHDHDLFERLDNSSRAKKMYKIDVEKFESSVKNAHQLKQKRASTEAFSSRLILLLLVLLTLTVVMYEILLAD